MIKYGFYNSINNDRLYDSKDLGHIFDGIINDGVYGNIYHQFRVRPGTNRFEVNIDTGRAWFHGTWIYNDQPFNLQVTQNGWIVIEINETDRVNRIRFSNSVVNSTSLHMHPIAKIVNINSDGTGYIRDTQIENFVGTSQCPLVTGPLKVMTIDQIVSQWSGEWRDFKNERKTEWDRYLSEKDKEIANHITSTVDKNLESKWTIFRNAKEVEWGQFKVARTNEWYTWLNGSTKTYAEQWASWYKANTEGKSERWEAWYAKMTADSQAQWNEWFHDTTVGQIEKWWDWWEEYHQVMTSAMIQQWWDWWNKFKTDKETDWQTWWNAHPPVYEQQWTDWWNANPPVYENRWQTWWNAHPPVYEQQWTDWWNAHPPVYEQQWTDWWNANPPVYETKYSGWYADIKDKWEQFQDAADRWFEDFKDEHDTVFGKVIPLIYDLTDSYGGEILDSNGDPIGSKNYVPVL